MIFCGGEALAMQVWETPQKLWAAVCRAVQPVQFPGKGDAARPVAGNAGQPVNVDTVV
jgi:hypothetical protein